MENIPAQGGDAAGSMEEEEEEEEEDRISQLPQHILQHHILSHLSQIDAVRTTILSKSWRYLGSTRPKLEFHLCSSVEMKEKTTPVSVLENTLQRYYDQKLSIQEFVVRIPYQPDSNSISHLNKWIPIVLMNMGVKKFNLYTKNHLSPPLVVFQAEFLEELYLEGCNLDQINNNCINVNLRMLKRLDLRRVYIDNETFVKIMSSCPLIEHLVLDSCERLFTVKLNKARNLKHFYCQISRTDDRIGSIEIDDDATTSLETISIDNCQKWHNYYSFFPRLKSLYLWEVHLPNESLNNLSSSNCPCLEELQIHYCSGFTTTEFKLSNRTIKRLIINVPDCPLIKAHIDAENMRYFELRNIYLPSVSFATTSREWKSQIDMGYFYSDFFDVAEVSSWNEWNVWFSSADVLSTWHIKLYEFLKALSQSQISLDIHYLPILKNQVTYEGGSCEPVVVEHLCLRKLYSSSEIPVLLDCLFRKFRPRYIGLSLPSYANSLESQLAECIWKTLVNKRETRQCDFWQQDLEESSIQVSNKNTNEWHRVQVCALSNNQSIRFRLKWRDFA